MTKTHYATRALTKALTEIHPIKNTHPEFHAQAQGQVLAAFYDGGARKAQAKARIIMDAYTTGIGVNA